MQHENSLILFASQFELNVLKLPQTSGITCKKQIHKCSLDPMSCIHFYKREKEKHVSGNWCLMAKKTQILMLFLHWQLFYLALDCILFNINFRINFILHWSLSLPATCSVRLSRWPMGPAWTTGKRSLCIPVGPDACGYTPVNTSKQKTDKWVFKHKPIFPIHIEFRPDEHSCVNNRSCYR